MKPIEIEGICLTTPLIEFIKDCQTEKGFLNVQVETIDSAITAVACETSSSEGFSDKDALRLIADLSQVKRYIKLFGKEAGHE
ncbi:MAG: hypothetical protein LBF62_11905 [Tannerellaceae bacterium]|jgi:hypothetical protein|nr:hypothetical protein [Tannerellaceae bacterium]